MSNRSVMDYIGFTLINTNKKRMKTFKNYLFLFALVALVASCKNAPKGEKATTSDAAPVTNVASDKSLNVNTANSNIMWTGSKIASSHTGTIGLSSGSLKVSGDKITGGEFVIDMTTIKNTDLPAAKQGDLVGHLSNEDFFDVPKFPTAKFVITKVTALAGNPEANCMVYGNLTLKEQTKSIGFKANAKVGPNGVSVSTPDFTIDRTDFGIQYGSTKLADVVKDKAISDDIGLKINLSAS